MKAVIVVRLKPDVPDAAGRILQERLVDIGFSEVKEGRVGKVIELDIEAADRDSASERVKQMCERLLVNNVIEDYVVVSLQ